MLASKQKLYVFMFLGFIIMAWKRSSIFLIFTGFSNIAILMRNKIKITFSRSNFESGLCLYMF